MKRFGTKYGGWNIPIDINLTSESIIYSAGVGEDISFDILIQEAYNSNIILIDPTNRAKKHYEEIQDFYKTSKPNFTGDIQNDYIKMIENSKPNFLKFNYIQKGLWLSNNILKFYKPSNDKYVSHTLIENMYSNNYEIVEVDSIKNIMKSLNHTYIDVLKLDIEGSEIVVLNQMLNDNIFPKYICIEFDLHLKKCDHKNETSSIITRLIELNYIMLENDNWNCIFIHNK
jgi:FkbM family methyltransferase